MLSAHVWESSSTAHPKKNTEVPPTTFWLKKIRVPASLMMIYFCSRTDLSMILTLPRSALLEEVNDISLSTWCPNLSLHALCCLHAFLDGYLEGQFIMCP